MSKLKKDLKKTNESHFWKKSWTYLAGIIFITILIYSNSIKNDFIYQLDDDGYITNCSAIKAINSENIQAIFTNAYVGLYLPLTMLTYMVEYHFFGLNPAAYHTTNLLLHLINVLLVFLLIYKIKPNPLIAGIVTLFFAIHPMHVESVSWLSERKDLLFSMFYLLGLNTYIFFARNQQSKYYLLTILAFILALFSKTLAISFPFFLILMDWYYGRKYASIKVLAEKIPFFALSLTFGLIAIYFGKTLNSQDTITPYFSWFNRIFLVSDAILFYLYQMVAPINLAVYHYYPKTVGGALPLRFYISGAVLLLVVIAMLWLLFFKIKKNRKDIILGLIFFVIPTSVILHIVPLGRAYTGERYTYLSYIGLFFLFAIFAEMVFDNKSNIYDKIKPWFAGFLVIVALAFSFLTWQRNNDWKDSMTMFTDLIEKYPDHGHPYLCRGITKFQFGDNKGALEDYNQSIKFDSLDAKVFSNRASVRGIFGDYKGALDDCNKALKIEPEYINALSNRAAARLYLNDLTGAFDDFTACIRLDSSNLTYYRNRIMVSEKLGKSQQLLADYKKLILSEPANAANFAGRGVIYYKDGNYNLAINDFSKALQLKPSLNGVFFNRGNAYFSKGQFELAISDFSKVIEYEKNNASAYFNRGICYLKLNQKENACNDFNLALSYGKEDALKLINQHCK